jgi:hypothetical protein
METVQRIGDLEIEQDIVFQRREWSAQRAGWALMALTILAALAGLLGHGPLSSATAGSQNDPIWIEHERFERWQAPAQLRLHLGTNSAVDGQARVWLSRDYVEQIQIEQVTPQPDRVEAGPDRITYVFDIGDTSPPAAITFYVKPQTIGRLAGRAGLADSQPVSFSQFVYP